MLSNLAFGSSTKSPQTVPSVPLISPNTPHAVIFSSIDDELHDARCVYSQGQEEDLRYALERIIKRVEELVSLADLLLIDAMHRLLWLVVIATQSDIEVSVRTRDPARSGQV